MKILSIAILIGALALIIYRAVPAVAGAPVFSIDAWPALADSKFLIVHSHAQILACSGMPSCYAASWPGLVLLTSMFSLVTSLSLFWSPPAITLAISLLFAADLVLIAGIIYPKARPYAALLGAASAPFNLFYTGYKEEMLAMPLFALMLYLLIRSRTEKPGLTIKTPVVLSALMLALGVIDSHHYTTFIMISTLAIFAAYEIASSRLVKIDRPLLIFTLGVAGLTLLYYAGQSFEPLKVATYNLSFLFTVTSYVVVIALIEWQLVTNDKYAKYLPLVYGVVMAAGVASLPLLAKMLYSQVTPSVLVLILADPFFLLIAFSVRVVGRLGKAGVLVMSWTVAPLALGFSSLLDGNSLLTYRGLTSLMFPTIILAAVAVAYYLSGKGEAGIFARRPLKIAIALFLVASIGLGTFAEVQPYIQPRNLYNGVTWYYPMSEIQQIETMSSYVPSNKTLYTDLPTASFLLFQGYPQNSTAAVPTSFAKEAANSTLMLSKMDTNEFYFLGEFDNIGVSRSTLSNSSLVFNDGTYELYA